MEEKVYSLFESRIAILASMHGKEKVIGPILKKKLGLGLELPKCFNSDKFGTFTGELERPSTQMETAILKAKDIVHNHHASIVISSEGAFNPHPVVPFVTLNREVVILMDVENDLLIHGEALSTETNFDRKTISSLKEAMEFCNYAKFPEHAVILRSSQNEIIKKGIQSWGALEEAYNELNKQYHPLMIETDMRAMYNPTRMKVIEAATLDLVNNLYKMCPVCEHPGFNIIERVSGLECGQCGLPTKGIKVDVYGCKKCGNVEEHLFPKGVEREDPARCSFCNP